MSFTVAIDGPAASGKGTIARAVAGHFGFAHLDTGLLYRAVAAAFQDGTDPVEAARNLSAEALEDQLLRTPQIAQTASRVAAIPEVRSTLLDFQRAFARRAGGAVLDGRDIGTVIVPRAQAKLFVTASADVRATRRHAELIGRGIETTLEEVLTDVLARDQRDTERKTAPLRPADDAYVLDTSDLDVAQAVAKAVAYVAQVRDETPASPT